MKAQDMPIARLSRVGPALEKQLKTMGIETCRDLIFYFPYRFDDFSQHAGIGTLRAGVTATIKGRIDMIANRRSRNRRMMITEGLVSDETGSIKVIWFNQPFLIKNLRVGDLVSMSGKTSDTYYDLHMVSPAYEKVLSHHAPLHTDRLVPIYSLPHALSQKQFRTLMRAALDSVGALVPDVLPADLCTRMEFSSLSDALEAIHFPGDADAFQRARDRFAFEELFVLQLYSQSAKRLFRSLPAHPIRPHRAAMNEFFSQLPFSFTPDQKRAAREILTDMRTSVPMNRMLQGDVGSGKTVVAALAMVGCFCESLQVAYMAPTEVLAMQHFSTLVKLFAGFNARIALVTAHNQELGASNEESGATELKTVSKDELRMAIAQGHVDIIIGTHALIQEHITFKHLAFVVVDEQHRFGVRQRKLLKEKNSDGLMPHVLSMSATPIPRSLALTIYGDLDISTIKKPPTGRKKIITKIVPPSYREWTYDFLRNQIHKGRQAFIVCPIIDPSDSLGARCVKDEYKRLHAGVFHDIRLGLLHGKMKKEEKEKVMRQMSEHALDMLVTTSVVEVGIDIPNASIMLIEGAERFGLAQLHQLRGRVGRSTHQSYCFLLPSEASAHENKRLKILTLFHDGFVLAEKDLELRGEGDIVGLRQSGLPTLKMASPSDTELIQKARDSAREYSEHLERYPCLQERIAAYAHDVHLE